MARDLKGLSVFVASPGGLEAERKKFFEVISRFNADEALEAGFTFVPQGHELAYAGAGRAQALINEQVRRADYCLVVFWDKWGMPPDEAGPFTSGTEEEFSVAIEALENPSLAMLDVVVLFKGVSDRQMSDPGSQLQKVLDFKKRLEAERRVLYRTFDTLDEFTDELRRLLAKWLRDWGTGTAQKAPLPPPRTPPALDKSASLLDQAKQAAKAGQITVAHELYTRATTGAYDRESWTEYVRFLRRAGRFGLLQRVGDKMIEKARDLNDHQGAAEGLSNIGIAKRAQGQRVAAIQYFDRALYEVDRWEATYHDPTDTQSMRAFILDNKGLTWRRMRGHLGDAIAAIEEAITLHAGVGDVRGQGHALRNIGVVQAQVGQLDHSLESLRKARDLFEDAGDERAVAMTLSSLGETYELMGKLRLATESFELALEKNVTLGNSQGKSMNLSQLSRVMTATNDLPTALDYAEGCLALGEESGSPEGLAAGLHATGRVHLAMGDARRATEVLEDALAAFQQLDQPAGVAGTALALGAAHLAMAEKGAATEYLQIAEEALRESPHYGLEGQASQLREQLHGNSVDTT